MPYEGSGLWWMMSRGPCPEISWWDLLVPSNGLGPIGTSVEGILALGLHT